MRKVTFVLLVCLTATASVATGTIIRVPSEYSTIQAGIDAAVDGDTVLVADGTYSGAGNWGIDFHGKAILVTSSNGPEATIIDCKFSHRGFVFHTGEDSNSVLQGFTIEDGDAEYGGGILCLSSPKIENNIIKNCKIHGIRCARQSSPIIEGNVIKWNTGSGIYCESSGSSLMVRNNILHGNTSGGHGGGIGLTHCSAIVEGNTITSNISDNIYGGWGGGIYCVSTQPVHIIGNTIIDNYAGYSGGGIYYEYGSPIIEGNFICGNFADHDVSSTGGEGGGLSIVGTDFPSILANTIVENTAYAGGGGIYCDYATLMIADNVIAGNRAYEGGQGGWGGGIYCDYGTSAYLYKNTFVGNCVKAYGGGIFGCYNSSISLTNTILWGDSAAAYPEIFVDQSSTIEVNYSDIQGGWEGEGNIDALPRFVLPKHRDYRLRRGSPCVDSGHPDSLDPDGTRSDMGAFYFDQSTPITIYLTPDTTVISRNSNLGVTYTVINIDYDPMTFSLQTDIILPNGEPYPGNPIVGPKEITLLGGKTKQRWIKHRIPGNALLGVYTYTTTLSSVIFNDVIDEDSFTFVVEE